MVLSASREIDHYIDQESRTLKVAGSTTIYKGALVSVQSDGYAAPLTAGEAFVGIAYETIDNSAGADGIKTVRMYTLGDFEHALSGAAITDVGMLFLRAGVIWSPTQVQNAKPLRSPSRHRVLTLIMWMIDAHTTPPRAYGHARLLTRE